jgi:NADH-quinone oxidoreductase subunit H
VNLFLGGWNIGFLFTSWQQNMGIFANLLGVVVFVLKAWLLVFVMMWVRWTLPRLRIDQVMMTCLKYLLPISCVLLLGVAVWQAFVDVLAARIVGYVLCALTVGGLGWVVFNLAAAYTKLPPGGVPSQWTASGSALPDLAKT